MTELLTTEEAARFLRLQPATIYKKMRRGVFTLGVHYYRIPGEIGPRFDKEALVRWLKGENKPGLRMAKGYVIGE